MCEIRTLLLVVVLGAAPAGTPAGSDPADPLEPCRQNEVFAKLLQLQTRLETLIAREQDPGEQGRLRFRLADIFIQQASSCPRIADTFREKAVRLYRHILSSHPEYKRRGEVRYRLAVTLGELRRTQEALEVHRQIVRDGGKFVPEALLAIGEYHFQQNQLDRARALYQRVLRHEDAQVYTYALYKLGWVYFNLQQWEQAARCFARLIQDADRRSRPEERLLQKEALWDFVRAYSRYGDPRQAPAVFARLANDRVRPMLDRLARILSDQGKDKQAIEVDRHLVEHAPDGLSAARCQLRIIESTVRCGDKRQVLEEIRSFGPMLQRARRNRGQLPADGRQELAAIESDAKALFERLLGAWTREGELVDPGAGGAVHDLRVLVHDMFP